MKSLHLPRLVWLLLLFIGLTLPVGWSSLTVDARASPQVGRSDSQTAAYQFINGDFETGRGVGWSEYSSSSTEIVVKIDDSMPIQPHDNDNQWMAWLGHDFDEHALISQWITVPPPSDSINPKLSYYEYVLSDEEICGYDIAIVYVNSEPWKYIDLCDNNEKGWVSQSHDLLPKHTGELHIEFVIVTDDQVHSSWFIDDVTLVDERCRRLTLSRNAGKGSAPTALPEKSPDCSSGHYTAGQKIALTAKPDDGRQVVGWSGTANDSSTDVTNTLIMPAAAHRVSVTYDFEVTDRIFAPVVVDLKKGVTDLNVMSE